MSPLPLHKSDGISTEARYRGVARGYVGYRHYGYGGYRRYGYRGYGYRGYRAVAGYGSSAAKCAGARYGVQGTFAVSGIDTLGGGGLWGRPYLIWKAIDFPWLAASRLLGPPELPSGYVVKDATGQALAYVYAPARRAPMPTQLKCLRWTKRGAWRATLLSCQGY